MTVADALRLGRISNLPTVWSSVLAALVLAGSARSFDPALLALLLVALSLFYTAGMFLNDFFDREIDSRERPERPIPSGRVGPHTVLGAGVVQLGAAIGLLTAASWRAGGPHVQALASALALAGAIVVYDVWHKKNPASPFLMGGCRALVYVTVALAATAALPRTVLLGAALLFLYVVGLTFAARFRFRAIGPLIAGISLLDAALIAVLAPALTPFLLAVACFGLTLVLQSFVSGT